MILAAVVVGTFIIGNLLGWLVHRVLHSPRMGKLHRDHVHHHTTIYPPDDFLSDTYREPPGGDSQGLYYLTPILLLAIAALLVFGWIYGVVVMLLGTAVLKANGYLHDATHIRGHKLEKYAWFLQLRRMHVQHHINEATNLGIFVWFPDKLMRTYDPVDERSTLPQ